MADYSKLIGKQTLQAFKLAGSLTKTATFHLKTETGFDFGAKEPVVNNDGDVTKQVLVIKTEQKTDVVRKQLLIETLQQLDIYDTLTLEGATWNIDDLLLDNGYTQIIVVSHG